jgi:LPXTG-site transpeptidase (sortase) family protein
METPGDWQEGGWYMESGRPGEQKNVIVNGHYDTNYGAPGAFYNLKNVQEGAKVEIVDNYGRIFNYNVVKLTYLDSKDPSRLNILEDEEGKSTLTLITCGGVWFPGSGYNKRLVVQAELDGQAQTSLSLASD